MGPSRNWERTEWKRWKAGYVAYDGWTDGVSAQRAKRVLTGPKLVASDRVGFSLAHEFLLQDQFPDSPDMTGARQRTCEALFEECQETWHEGKACKHFDKHLGKETGVYVVETPAQIEELERAKTWRSYYGIGELPRDTETVRSDYDSGPKNARLYAFCTWILARH